MIILLRILCNMLILFDVEMNAENAVSASCKLLTCQELS